ncbi:MAG: hypothetical protein DMG30_07170 [Acidobacteria bacterium]|nr:MAG: hypothetical protein DMG30_07170 [Acidobacteriota bacterium]
MSTFTLVHVVISLVGIVSGFVVAYGMLTGKRVAGGTVVFLASTVLTSVTGFLFPFHRFLPSHGVGIVSLVLLAVAIAALYIFHLSGGWRRVYVMAAITALYLNVFVLIIQLFMKVPALESVAPKQTESPFVATQVLCLALFVVLGTLATKRFGAERARTA